MVEITERRPANLWQAAGWPEDGAALAAALGAWLGDPPPVLGWASSRAGRTVMALAPGRWLLLAEVAAQPPATPPLVITDLSAARLVLRLAGAKLEPLLARAGGVDPDRRAFPPGRVAQTLFHHVPVLLHRIEVTTADLLVPRSWAHALRRWLDDALAGAP